MSILRVTRDSDDLDDDDDDSSDWGSSSDEGGTVPVSLPQFEAQVPQVDGARCVCVRASVCCQAHLFEQLYVLLIGACVSR